MPFGVIERLSMNRMQFATQEHAQVIHNHDNQVKNHENYILSAGGILFQPWSEFVMKGMIL